MKKIFSILLTAVLTLALSAVSFAETVSAGRLKGAKQYSDDGISAAVVVRNTASGDQLIVSKGETLIVDRGQKLTLKNGCRIDGTLFVCAEAELSVTGGRLDIRGSVLSEGKVSVGKKASISIAAGGELYSAPSGSFKSATASVKVKGTSVILSAPARVSVKGCKAAAKEKLCSGISGAVVVDLADNGAVESSRAVSADEARSMLSTLYFDTENTPKGRRQLVTVAAENGNALTVGMYYDMISDIGRADIASVVKLTGITPASTYNSPYPEIYHNKKVYTYDFVFSNQEMIDGELVSTDDFIDIDNVKKTGKYLGRSIVDHSYRTPPSEELCVTGSKIVFDVYDIGDNELVLVATEPFDNGVYCHYLLTSD